MAKRRVPTFFQGRQRGMNEKLLFFIVEDDKLMRRIIADFIREMVRSDEISEEVEIYDSSSGEEALKILSKEPFDAIMNPLRRCRGGRTKP